MNVHKLNFSILVVGLGFIVLLAAIIVSIMLVKDFAHSIFRKLGLLHQAQEPMPMIEVYPTGDIPKPEINKLSVPR